MYPRSYSFPWFDTLVATVIVVVLLLFVAKASLLIRTLPATDPPESFDGRAVCSSDMDCERMERRFHKEAEKVLPEPSREGRGKAEEKLERQRPSKARRGGRVMLAQFIPYDPDQSTGDGPWIDPYDGYKG